MSRTLCRQLCQVVIFALLSSGASGAVAAEPPTPTFDFERLLNTKTFWNSGSFQLGDLVMGFAPETSTTEIMLFNDKREVVAQQTAYAGYQGRTGAWAVVRPKAEQFRLQTPGIYQLVFSVNGVPATRFPFRLIQTSAGDDPFNPEKKFAFDGYWKRLAAVRLRPYDFKRTGTWPVPTVWVGELDLPEGKDKDMFESDLLHNGKLVAQSNRKGGFIAREHYRKREVKLLQLHEPNQLANAGPFLLEDYKDGDYELRLTRHSDRKVFRNFRFKVTDGKIAHMDRSTLGFQPAVDYLVPRGMKGRKNMTIMEEVVWVFSPPDA